jgi:hypothetical protein
MANGKHVAVLKKGVEAWNAWRDENPDIRPNLSDADLREANLRETRVQDRADPRSLAMFEDCWKYDWVLPIYRYEGLEPLLATLAEKVIAPAEGKVKALEERRRMIEAELTKPQ